uniref:Fibronectin type-III domain-containing protein n=1 Tax=Steinernema glaseri TaxID=37863 RepID=A0A1I7ZMT7_9BILA
MERDRSSSTSSDEWDVIKDDSVQASCCSWTAESNLIQLQVNSDNDVSHSEIQSESVQLDGTSDSEVEVLQDDDTPEVDDDSEASKVESESESEVIVSEAEEVLPTEESSESDEEDFDPEKVYRECGVDDDIDMSSEASEAELIEEEGEEEKMYGGCDDDLSLPAESKPADVPSDIKPIEKKEATAVPEKKTVSWGAAKYLALSRMFSLMSIMLFVTQILIARSGHFAGTKLANSNEQTTSDCGVLQDLQGIYGFNNPNLSIEQMAILYLQRLGLRTEGLTITLGEHSYLRKLRAAYAELSVRCQSKDKSGAILEVETVLKAQEEMIYLAAKAHALKEDNTAHALKEDKTVAKSCYFEKIFAAIKQDIQNDVEMLKKFYARMNFQKSVDQIKNGFQRDVTKLKEIFGNMSSRMQEAAVHIRTRKAQIARSLSVENLKKEINSLKHTLARFIMKAE